MTTMPMSFATRRCHASPPALPYILHNKEYEKFNHRSRWRRHKRQRLMESTLVKLWHGDDTDVESSRSGEKRISSRDASKAE